MSYALDIESDLFSITRIYLYSIIWAVYRPK